MAKKRNAPIVQKTNGVTKESKGNVIMFDTNVIINDDRCIEEFLKQPDNVVVIARMVLLELDKLKSKSEIKFEARTAINAIYDFRKQKSDRVFISWGQNFSKLDLDKSVPDHQIIATFNHVLKDDRFSGYKKFKLITDDAAMLIIASELFANNPKVEVAPYNHIRVKVKKRPKVVRPIALKDSDYKNGGLVYSPSRFRGLKENAGILLRFGSAPEFMAIRKGDRLIPLDINNSVCGIKPMKDPEKERENWEQALFAYQLTDPKVSIALVSGVAGTGKTLLALAAALQQRNKYKKIILTRPAIPLEDEDQLGFLPGDLNAKMFEYVIPFIQDLEVIIEENSKNQNFFMKKGKNMSSGDLLDDLNKDAFAFLRNLNITVNAIQHYRGRTYHNTWIIVDEAQNLSPAQIKTIITRAGRNCKIVLTGDLEQIDKKKFLNSENSGLAYAMAKMEGQAIVGIAVLEKKVRSELSALAEKLL